MKKNSLIILSGGMDSVTMLHEYATSIEIAVTFNYGSNHNMREIECAKKHCEQLGIEHIIIDLSFIGDYFHSSLLEGAEAVPEGEYDFDNMKSTVVPFRNGIMLAAAAGLAESRASFIKAMSRAISEGTYDNIMLYAPYTHLTKGQIASRGKCLDIDYATTYSCYKGGEYHCGVCGTCRERRQALAEAGIDDPTVYQED